MVVNRRYHQRPKLIVLGLGALDVEDDHGALVSLGEGHSRRGDQTEGQREDEPKEGQRDVQPPSTKLAG